MTKSEAAAKAREIILAMTEVDTDPDSIEFKNVGGRRLWTAFFGRDHFIGTSRGYTLVVNDKTGEVSVFGPD